MNWKSLIEFLKPDWKKIVVFAFFVSTFFLKTYSDGLWISELNLPTRIFFALIFLIWALIMIIPMVLGTCTFGDVMMWCSPFHGILAYVLYFVISYLLSCVIVRVFNEIKGT